jgi:hypothetical protein
MEENIPPQYITRALKTYSLTPRDKAGNRRRAPMTAKQGVKDRCPVSYSCGTTNT